MSRGSLDCRIKSGNDKREEKPGNDNGEECQAQRYPPKGKKAVFFAPAAQIDSFFKASPASGAALKDKGLKLKSEHRKNIKVIVALTVVVQTAASKYGIPRAVA